MTSTLSENNLGNWPLNARIRMVNITPKKVEVPTATTTENFAALGCPAPSSLATLTLKKITVLLLFF